MGKDTSFLTCKLISGLTKDRFEELNSDYFETNKNYFGTDYWALMEHSCGSADVTVTDLKFLEGLFKKHSVRSVLDLCCGRGRHVVPLAKSGYEVTGVDVVEDSISTIKNKLENSMKVELLCADVRELQLNKKFDAALFMQTSFGYFSDEDNVQLLKMVREHLTPDGLLVLDLPNRDGMVKNFQTRDWVQFGSTYFLVEHKFDYLKSRRNTIATYIDEQGIRQYGHSIRMYTTAELGYLLEQAGFKQVEVFGDFTSRQMTFAQDTRRIQITAVK